MQSDKEKYADKIEMVREVEGYEHATDEEALEIIRFFEQFSILTFHIFSTSKSEAS